MAGHGLDGSVSTTRGVGGIMGNDGPIQLEGHDGRWVHFAAPFSLAEGVSAVVA
jgi:hypothetical protein